MLFKLSLRNAKRQLGDYLVYFITITLTAALLYSFNSFIDSKEILNLSQMEIMKALPGVIVLSSIAVVFIMGWLVFYTMRFMLEKRSREFGIYMLMGIEARQVSQIFLMENMVIGGMACLLGVPLGNLLFQGLRAVMLWMYKVPYHFRFTFSLTALGLSAMYFVLIYAFALWRSNRRIKRVKICDLLDFERRNEGELVKKKAHRRLFLVLSGVAGLCGLILVPFGEVLSLQFLGAILLVLFLYGFFINFSSGVPAFFNKRPGRKYHAENLLVFRSLSAKIGSMGITMATIALLLTGTMIAEGIGVSLTYAMNRRAELYTSSDLFISEQQVDADFSDYFAIMDKKANVKEDYEYNTYFSGGRQFLTYLNKYTTKDVFNSTMDQDMVMQRSDYDKLRQLYGLKKVKGEKDGYIIHCLDALKKPAEAFHEPLDFNGYILKKTAVYTEPFTQVIGNGNGDEYILVVPDKVVSGLPGANHCYAAQTKKPVGEKVNAKLESLQYQRAKDRRFFGIVVSKKVVRDDMMSQLAIFGFPLFYIAIVLTMTAATILTVQFLSQSNRLRKEFLLLHKLGQSKKDMVKALRWQFTLFFVMPIILPIFITVFMLFDFNKRFDSGIIENGLVRLELVGAGVLIFLVLYLLYVVASYLSIKRNVLPDTDT